MLNLFIGLFILGGMFLAAGILVVLIGSFGMAKTNNEGAFDFESFAKSGAKVTFWTLLLLGIHDLVCFPILLYFIYQLKL